MIQYRFVYASFLALIIASSPDTHQTIYMESESRLICWFILDCEMIAIESNYILQEVESCDVYEGVFVCEGIF